MRLYQYDVQGTCEMAPGDRHVLGGLDLTGLAVLDCVEFGAENGTGLD